ncbi:MAG: hypothetical protein LBP81_07520 [Treponema sp.]|nr:hypothetical protein [Treponema sp.]
MNPRELQEGLESRLRDIKIRKQGEGTEARLVNIDGKTIRGSGFHVAGAWIGEHGLTPGQAATEGKRLERREDLTAVIQYRTFRRGKGKETVQTDRYYISRGDFSADEFMLTYRKRKQPERWEVRGYLIPSRWGNICLTI